MQDLYYTSIYIPNDKNREYLFLNYKFLEMITGQNVLKNVKTSYEHIIYNL